jgi:hypothetical protein
MGWKFCSRSSKLLIEDLEQGFAIPSCEEWQGILYTTTKHSTLNYLTNGGLLWIPIEVSKLFTC